MEIGRAADDLARMTPCLLEQDIEVAVKAARIERGLLTVDGRLQALQPFGFHLLGYLALHLGRRCSRPRRIFEREGACIADLIDQRERRAEILLGFARE